MKKILNKHNSGFSLVELLVGSTLSLILIAATITVYLSSKRTATVNEGLVNAQNDAQLALQFLKEDIARSGWANNTSLGYTLASPLTDDYDALEGGDVSDTLKVHYESCLMQGANINQCRADGLDARDCNGVVVPGATIIVNEYKVNASGELLCNNQPMISNVESFQVLYGEVTAAGLNYITANAINDPTKIQSIRFGIMVRSENDTSSDATLKNIALLDKVISVNDKKLRLKFESTIVMLNKPVPFDGGL